MKFIPIIISMFMISACTTSENKSQISSSNNVQNVGYKNAAYNAKNKKFTGYRNNQPSQNTSETSNRFNTIQEEKVILDVPLISQNPELKFGCEVASLTMLLRYAGFKVNKLQLANELKKDPDPLERTREGDITKWGDPNQGFVGDMSGKRAGYAVFDRPLEDLMKRYLKERTLNLTGEHFTALLQQIKLKKPVVVWTTGDYQLPDRWESWRHGSKTIRTPLDLHVIVLVGYDSKYVYVNDPLSVKKNQKIDKNTFIKSWTALKQRALSYR